MPAPDYATCWNIAAPISARIASIIETATGLAVFVDNQDEGKSTPRVDISFQLGAEVGQFQFTKAGATVKAAWDALLTCEIVTHRKKNAASTAPAVAAIRDALSLWRDPFNPSALPYHAVVEMRQDGSPRTIDVGSDEDSTTLNFYMLVQVRPSAWPEVV